MPAEAVAVSTTTFVYPCLDCQSLGSRIIVTPTHLFYCPGASAHAPI